MFKAMVLRICSINLNTLRALSMACFVVPICFGILSFLRGQDSNWDLLNYHFYNAFALFNNKLGIDLAPAGFQTYFNPLLDVPYYVMTLYWPAPLVGFTMGVVHGLNFVLLLGIALKALPNLPQEDRYRVPLLLATAGCLTGNFLSELGNTMGDNATSLFVLAALLIVLSNWTCLLGGAWKSAAVAVVSGAVVGLGVGLKLTNAIYAFALAMSFLVLPLNLFSRLRLAFFFSAGVLIGLVFSNGYWFVEMWRHFSNPLFPQFSTLFPNQLARPISVADTSFLPKGVFEALLWPFIFAYDSHRVGQIRLPQIIWPILYSLFWMWCIYGFKAKVRGVKWLIPNSPSRYVIAFIVFAYPAWVALFSIYRYVVPMELLTPMVVYILLMLLFKYSTAKKVAIWIIFASVALVLLGGMGSWGHVNWNNRSFRIDVPALADPATTTVLLVGGDPYAFQIPFFSPLVSFIQVAGNFPESHEFASQVQSIVANRSGVTYALVEAHVNQQDEHVDKINQIAELLGLGCDSLRWVTKHSRPHAMVQEFDGDDSSTSCKFTLLPEDYVDLAVKNRESVTKAQQIIVRYGFFIEVDRCSTYKAFVGKKPRPYQLCNVRKST